MNKDEFTAYKHEEEVVLMEGTRFFVMKIEEQTINIPINSSAYPGTPAQRNNP